VSFHRYEAYRDSGVEWLGELPKHWGAIKFVRLVKIGEGQVDPRPEAYASMLLIAPNHVEAGTGRLLAQETASEQGADSGKYAFDAGVVVYSKIRPALAKAVIAPTSGLCSADMYPLTCGVKLSPGYLLYTILTSGFTAWATLESDRVAMPKINREKLNELRLPVPPLTEQSAIADFLDRETAKIDALIAEQERLITLLEEKRQAVISHIISKGLHPNAPMKDSGLTWPAEVPAHWGVLPLTRVVRQFVDYRGATPTKVERGIPLVTATQIKNGRIDHSLDPVFISDEEYAERMTRGFPEVGDILLTTEAPLGEVALIEDPSVAPGQ
jgi:type I restriction enzyme, S subunit